MTIEEASLQLHEQYQGKIESKSKVPVAGYHDLALAYSPGVAAPCLAIAKDPKLVDTYTNRANAIAVVTDGSAVLGLGDIGPKASLPVMEGKAILFKQFAGLDGVPICLDTKDPEEIIRTVALIAPGFAGINLEDISSPRCFEIEQALDAKLDIPVFHDDQHGTAIVVLAALMNALKAVNKTMAQIRVVVSGPGAAGTAITKILMASGVKDILVCDEHGILTQERKDSAAHKAWLAAHTNPAGVVGDLADALVGADVLIGVSVGHIVTGEMVATMNDHAIVFAMANPTPEVDYQVAKAAGAEVVGTGRSDYPNQINNVLVFPGLFKGTLAIGARTVSTAIMLATAKAIAASVPETALSAEHILPSLFADHATDNIVQYIEALP
ncbi:NAD(P)-dependent malic enzyme [Lacticaseibacillus daqingensis]|uniref:NAD(P)-dependent malic enzyme n=1 Tax=Lacticaseibacillus daqingensis TaxID=2486014 RepID=UPI000F793999|nr:NADP-dependent malic enzyme [Lacticaseibacillus daqingensis]